MRLAPHYIRSLANRALEEDCVSSDITSSAALGGSHLKGLAVLRANSTGVIAGTEVAAEVFRTLDPELAVKVFLPDGSRVEGGEDIASVHGSVESILGAERTALNLLQRMSGIATLTDSYVSAVGGTRATIVDTRKTVPGLRLLDKYSVEAGGGRNHRMSLADGILIKDNHIAAMRTMGMSMSDIVAHVRERAPHTAKLEIEVESVPQACEAIDAGADIVMLDNMTLRDMREVVARNSGRAVLEASGGITLKNVRDVAETGVDLISVGDLTHSVKAFDISLDFEFS